MTTILIVLAYIWTATLVPAVLFCFIIYLRHKLKALEAKKTAAPSVRLKPPF